jgi:hypothetical protein
MNTTSNVETSTSSISTSSRNNHCKLLMRVVDADFDHGRPPKQQKCCSSGIDFAFVLPVVDIGIVKHLSGDYREASECFFRALHCFFAQEAEPVMLGCNSKATGGGISDSSPRFSRSSSNTFSDSSHQETRILPPSVSVLSERPTGSAA